MLQDIIMSYLIEVQDYITHSILISNLVLHL
jgi:hypothetical protein